jgi:hypothetical protein
MGELVGCGDEVLHGTSGLLRTSYLKRYIKEYYPIGDMSKIYPMRYGASSAIRPGALPRRFGDHQDAGERYGNWNCESPELHPV